MYRSNEGISIGWRTAPAIFKEVTKVRGNMQNAESAELD
jgi:hypothetical protein